MSGVSVGRCVQMLRRSVGQRCKCSGVSAVVCARQTLFDEEPFAELSAKNRRTWLERVLIFGEHAQAWRR